MDYPCISPRVRLGSLFSLLPSSRELSTKVALLLLGARDGPIAFPSYPIAHWAFLQAYMFDPIHSTGPNCYLGFRPGWELFHSPQKGLARASTTTFISK